MRNAILFVLTMFSGSAFAQSFSISGNIKGLPDKTQVVLTDVSGKDTIAKTVAMNGAFSLKGKLNGTDSRLLDMPSVNKRVVLFMGNENVTVKGDMNANIDVSGSSSHKDYEDFIMYIKPLNDYVGYYYQQLQQSPTQSRRDSMSIMLNTIYPLYQQQVEQFIQRKSNSPMSALLIAYSFETDPNKSIEVAERRIAMLKGDALKSRYAESLSQQLIAAKIGAVGTKAMDFSQNDVNGKPVKLSSFKGKYVLVDFWASWCKPCRQENPNVVAAYNKYKDKNFTVLGVSLDQDKPSWLSAITADNLTWTHVSDLQFWNNAVAQLYKVQSIPQNFLIDPNGVIIGKNLRGEELLSKLEVLVK